METFANLMRRAEDDRVFGSAVSAAAYRRALGQGPDTDPEDCLPCEQAQQAQALVAAGKDILLHGLAVPYDTPTGDGRGVRKGALSWEADGQSVPIIWDREDGDHSGMTLGVVDEWMADNTGLYVQSARLFATDDEVASAAVARVAELIEQNALGWSVLMDDEELEITYKEPDYVEGPDGTVTIKYKTSDEQRWVTKARIRHLAVVDTPAWPGSRPALGPMEALAAAARVATYPAAHFEKFDSREIVPFQVTPDGRVFGHMAGEGCFRNGDTQTCKKYTQDSDPKLRNFHVGTATLDNGEVIRVGSLTCASLHADTHLSLDQQRQYHENTSTVWARVVAWEDSRGRLCASGSIVPGLDELTLSKVAGAPISVEKWPVPGFSGLTLCGAHAVVSPAWPTITK